MGSVRFRMSRAGARSLLSSPEVGVLLGSKADEARDAANAAASEDDMFNDPFDSDVKVLGDRAVASVFTATPHGFHHNAKHDTILRNL